MTILINNLGYYQNQNKVAKIIGTKEDVSFQVFNENNICKFESKSTSPLFDTSSEENVSEIDFTSLKETGNYYIVIGNERSSLFTISNSVYDKLEESILYMIEMQKCGMEVIDDKYKTFSHDACHTKIATIYSTNKKIDVSGGYHDAGDFGRYVTPGAKMIMELLLSYEINKNEETLKAAIYELDFFKKLLREDGGVYHKVTGYNFSGMIMPDKDSNELVVSPVSTTATADFCGVMAFASTIISSEKEQYLDLAKKAYSFLENNDNIPFYNPKEITTGQYEDDKSTDEIYFAKMSLYNATKDEYYLNDIKKYFPKSEDEIIGLGWEEMSLFGTYLFLRAKENNIYSFYNTLSKSFRKTINILVKRSNKDSFNVTLKSYPWGSNAYLMNNANAIFFGYLLYADEEYLKISSKLINYILGTNSLNMSFVTGFGIHYPSHPHHRPSVAKSKAMPGMLVGGPAEGLFDETIKQMKSNAPKAKTYIDDTESYSTNEICIYWNSPFLLALVLLKHLIK